VEKLPYLVCSVYAAAASFSGRFNRSRAGRVAVVLQMMVVLQFLSITLSTVQAQSASEPLWAAVERAVEKRRVPATCWGYEVEGVVVTAPGALDGLFAEEDDPAPVTPSPSLTYETRKEFQVDFLNGRVRQDDYEPSHSKDGLKQSYKIWLFDGQSGWVLNPSRREKRNGSAKAPIQLPSLLGHLNSINPLLWSQGVFHVSQLTEWKPSKVRDLGGEWAKDDQYIVWTVSLWKEKLKFHFDPKQDYHVVRCESLPRDHGEMVISTGHTLEVTYDQTAEGFKVASWTFSYPREFDKSFRVVRAEPVDSIPIEVFQEPADYVQPGMFVTKDGRPHIVTEAKTLVPWRPGSQLPARPRYWPWFIVPALIGAGIWHFRRRYQRLA
jgi:hypothetical protein